MDKSKQFRASERVSEMRECPLEVWNVDIAQALRIFDTRQVEVDARNAQLLGTVSGFVV